MSHRLVLGFPLATAITVGLFLLMQSLIQTEFQPQEDVISGEEITIIRGIREQPDDARDRKLPEKREAEPPPPPKQDLKDVDPGDLSKIDGGTTYKFETDVTIGIETQTDRDAVPIVRIPPEFPFRAKTGGWVLVQFDITPTGTVQNAVVVDSEPARIFDNSALKAIQKWKYRPKLIKGEPVFQYAMEQMITYEFEDDE